MPINNRLLTRPSSRQVENFLLLAVAPWLLFPSIFPLATFISLSIVVVIWLRPWIVGRSVLAETPFNLALLLLALSILIGIVVSADPDLTLGKATGLILGLTVWRAFVRAVPSSQSIAWSMLFFYLAWLGIATVGIFSADWRAKLPLVQANRQVLPERELSLPEAPDRGVQTNQLAGTMMFHLPVFASLLIGWRPEHRQRLLLGLVTVSLLFGAGLLVLTQSRSGWIGGAAGLAATGLIWAVVHPDAGLRRALWLGLGLAVAMTVIVILRVGPSRLLELWREPGQQTIVGDLRTFGFRLEVWRWATTAIGDFPFTGTGLGTFRRVVHRLYPIAVAPEYDIAHAHNIFIQVALDLGLIGLVSYLSSVGIALHCGLRQLRSNGHFRPLAAGLMSGMVAIHVYGLTDALAPGSKTGIIFWMALGLLATMERFGQTSDSMRAGSLIRPERLQS